MDHDGSGDIDGHEFEALAALLCGEVRSATPHLEEPPLAVPPKSVEAAARRV